MFYVNIDNVDDKQLAFCGLRLTFEGQYFKLYENYHGEEYVVSNSPPRYVYVDDLNDADCLKAAYAISVD